MSNKKTVRVYLQNTESAGFFYSNIVSSVVSILDLKARYQKGNSGGEEKHFWFINDDDVDSTKLPQKAWGIVNGDVITDKQYATMNASVQSETTSESASADF